MVAAIAFESVVKLLAFVAVGVFVSCGLFDGPADIFARAAARPGAARRCSASARATRLRLRAVVRADPAVDALGHLPAAPVPGDGGRERRRAASQARGLGVPALPAADQPVRAADRARRAAALRRRPAWTPRASCFRCRWPTGSRCSALVAFIGGLSAATGMVIVETIAVSTMVCNDLVMPLLLRTERFGARAGGDLSRVLLRDPPRRDRRWSCCSATCTSAIAGEAYALVSIGLISFAAVAQFAPAMLGGMYWRGGTAHGALAGLLLRLRAVGLHPDAAFDRQVGLARGPSFLVAWPLGHRPAQARAAAGPGRARQPDAFAVLEPAGQRRPATSRVSLVAHAVGARGRARRCCSSTSSAATQASRQRRAGVLARPAPGWPTCGRWPSASSGADAADAAVRRVRAQQGRRRRSSGIVADAQLVQFVETQLAGAIGSASARVMVASVVEEEALAHRRRDAHPRRGVAAARLLARARGQVALAAARHRRAARRQRAAQEPGPAEGRLHVLGDARAAHAADLDPRAVRADASTIRRWTREQRQQFLGIVGRRDRAPGAPGQPGAGHGQDRVRPRRVAQHRRRPARAAAAQAVQTTARDVPRARRRGRARRCPTSRAAAARRPRPADAGDAEPAVERRQVPAAGRRAGRACGCAPSRGRARWRCRTTAPACRPSSRR